LEGSTDNLFDSLPLFRVHHGFPISSELFAPRFGDVLSWVDELCRPLAHTQGLDRR
jgi:hypothetical protein